MIPKLRVWHKQFKLMKRVRKLDLDYERVFVAIDSSKRQKTDVNRTPWNFNNITIMQWTGLQDIDGKDIYLNDILSLDADNIMTFKVGWDVETAAFQLQTITGRFSGFYFTAIGACPTRVLGNAFENPELLQVANET